MKFEIHFEFRASLKKFQDLNFWDATVRHSGTGCPKKDQETPQERPTDQVPTEQTLRGGAGDQVPAEQPREGEQTTKSLPSKPREVERMTMSLPSEPREAERATKSLPSKLARWSG
jgi:hypothetical protein